jgi:hypothetical protein
MLIQIHSLLISVDFLDPSKVIPGLHSLESVPYATYQAHNISDRVIDFILKIFCLNVSYANVSVDGPGRYFLPSETTPVDYSADWAPEFSRHLKALSSPPNVDPMRLQEWLGNHHFLTPDQVPLELATGANASMVIIYIAGCSPYWRIASHQARRDTDDGSSDVRCSHEAPGSHGEKKSQTGVKSMRV